MNTKNEPEFEEQNVPELCGSRRLLPEEVTLEGEIEEVDGILNFYLACWFDVDQVFGTMWKRPRMTIGSTSTPTTICGRGMCAAFWMWYSIGKMGATSSISTNWMRKSAWLF